MATTSQAIQQQIADLARDLNNQIAVQNTYRNTGTKGIQGAYAGLDKGLAANQTDVGKIVTGGRSTIQSDYKRAGTNISEAEATLRSLLGDQGGLTANVATGPLAEIQKLSSERALSEADSLAAHQLLGTGYNTQAKQARADAKIEGTGQVAGLTTQIGADIADMQREYMKEKAAKQVEYAQALADERYKAEQLAIERARLASENAARRQAAAKDAAEANKYEGAAGLMRWMAENKVPADQAKQIWASIDSANASGHSEDAYSELAYYAGKHNSPYAPQQAGKGSEYVNRLLGIKTSGVPFKNAPGYTPWNNAFMNRGLDIFFGKYSGPAGE